MTRQQEFEKVNELMEENFWRADCGLFDDPNIVNDEMFTLFKGEYFELLICCDYGYFEVFGTTEEEFAELEKRYKRWQDSRLVSLVEGFA
ncbi:hypothetical protein EDX97_09500 [Absicoccus porci]|uniref:Uncharacterized protein n=1 Tax=Absicoccus porci TaxID=2486576 RepID=A0A3N0HYT4_9FIRM|nr:hypothetical protein [Absicoccus porci]RNM29848.1 hypothetical protein EDX97_09500 [Absicoccus porci]